MKAINETHDPALKSWIESAESRDSDFPLQNLPLAVFRRKGKVEAFRGGVGIGDQILDLGATANTGVLKGDAAIAAAACGASELNSFMAMGPKFWSALRLALSRALREGADAQAALSGCLVAQADSEYDVPARIGDFTDFYTSLFHATNIGAQFRPDNPLLPNYKWVPIGYHGRSSSIRVSGDTFPRPIGQLRAADVEQPQLGPCQRLDYELELGIFIGTGNERGQPIPIGEAESHVFGVCLLNDWSARDIQAWEYQPLGPFLSKNFASTLSPWIVTMEALAPYRVPFSRPAGDPSPLPYLDSAQMRESGAFDIHLEVSLETAHMRKHGRPAVRLSTTSYRHAYWTIGQMVTHHTVGGCNLRAGDLLGTGTLSGPSLDQAGALIELTTGGKRALSLPDGETRTYLEDGDAVIIRGRCEKQGAARIGFGECRGTVLPALPLWHP
ncbi:MAG: fumarylacetoacetase [Burkholderiaceae bacterium]|nr:fumarylacetoacetase [Burkholderiaceae bacterium]